MKCWAWEFSNSFGKASVGLQGNDHSELSEKNYELEDFFTMVVLWTGGSLRFPRGDTSGNSSGRGWLLASLSWLNIEYFEIGVKLLGSSWW